MIDAHVHIFPKVNGYGPKGKSKSLKDGFIDFGDGQPQWIFPSDDVQTSHTLERLLDEMDKSHVEKAVLILCPCYGDWTEYILDACGKYPDKFEKSAFFDPWASEGEKTRLSILNGSEWKNIKIEFSESGGLCGLYKGARLDDDSLDSIWSSMEKHGKTVSFDLGRPCDKSYQTEAISKIAKKYPGLKIVLCHLGQPSLAVESDPELWDRWKKQIDLGKLDNVWFDLSAMPYHVKDDEPYPFESTKRYFDIALSRIGSKKMMWGSDIPWLLGTADYEHLVSHGRNLVRDLSETEQAAILEKNAEDVYWR